MPLHRLLGQKSILAHILVKTVDEFRGMNPKEVVSYIEGQPYISTVPVEPGLTNTSSEKGGQRIVGFNSENGELNEGLVRFDIVFYARMKDGLSQIIINVEAQKDEPKGYEILNRAIFCAGIILCFRICRFYRIFQFCIHGLPPFCMEYSHQQKGIRPHLYYILALSLKQLDSTPNFFTIL